jgi:AcrR family transcriptional regulator
MVTPAPPVNRFSPAAPLSIESIARAAEHVVDSEGLPALTMRRLGRELGVEAMSIYHYVPNKDALERLLIQRLVAGVGDSMRVDDDPIQLLAAFTRSLRSALRRRAPLVPLALTRLPRTLFDAEASLAVRQRLVDLGFDISAATWIIDAFIGFAIGHVALEVTEGHSTPDDDAAAFETGLRFLLAGLGEEIGV